MVPKIIAPPPLLSAFCIGGGLLAGHFIKLPLLPQFPRFRIALCLFLFAVSISFLFAARWELVRHRTSPNPYRPTLTVVSSGMYRFSRNPIYVGFLLFVLAVSVAADTFWLLPAAAGLFFLPHFGVVKPEERYLSARFGADYDQFCRNVKVVVKTYTFDLAIATVRFFTLGISAITERR